MDKLDHITAMARLSTAMVDAARANDWPSLADLEHQLAAHRDTLAALTPNGPLAPALSPADAQSAAELMRQILADGEEVLRHVQPFQASVRRLLSAGKVGRSLRQAYAVGP